MKRIMMIITAMLISVSAMAGSFNAIPFAITEANYNNPTFRTNLENKLCDLIGLPKNDDCRAIARGLFPLTKVENCVGNASYGVGAGETWYISCNSGKNVLGDNMAQIAVKLAALKAAVGGTTLIGEITKYPNEWFKEWGIVDATPPEII